MNDFGDERQRLERPGAQLFEQQQRRKVAQVAFVSQRKNRPDQRG